MKSTLRVTPRYDERQLPDDQEFYTIELNMKLDSTELADISYITEELTKTVGHMEYTLKKMAESRKEEPHDK